MFSTVENIRDDGEDHHMDHPILRGSQTAVSLTVVRFRPCDQLTSSVDHSPCWHVDHVLHQARQGKTSSGSVLLTLSELPLNGKS